MIKIDVFVEDKNWKKRLSNPVKYLNKKSLGLKNSIKLSKNKKYNFSVVLSGNKEIRDLNKKFRKKNKTTDVLSFPFYESKILKKIKRKNIYLGDIILNYYKINKRNFEYDFDRLWIHGFLHLLGYKHDKDTDFYKMNKLEKLILKKINFN
tara:strand:+ start:8509 stop:8961 length:453 start_codon:yes stop_codon:yes gene_type:complete